MYFNSNYLSKEIIHKMLFFYYYCYVCFVLVKILSTFEGFCCIERAVLFLAPICLAISFQRTVNLRFRVRFLSNIFFTFQKLLKRKINLKAIW